MLVEAAYERCRVIAREEARNFYYGFVLLPPERRAAMYAAYAFSRRCDDSVDGPEPLETKMTAIGARREELAACYAGTPPEDDPVLVALADTVRRFEIPERHLTYLIDGCEMDLTIDRYATFADLRGYCDRVAGAVGLVSLWIFGFSDDDAPARAEELGVGMQLVNIMRDVAEDAEAGRIYLPADEMAEMGVTEADLGAGRMTPELRDLMRAQGQRARAYLVRGERLLPMLDRRSRMCVAMLSRTYREVLRTLEQRGYDVFAGRASLSAPKKITLMAKTSASVVLGR